MEPFWIENALYEIIEEYFDHNNPIINKKMLEFEEKQMPEILNSIYKNEERFKKGIHNKRIIKTLKEQYELELIKIYGVVEKETPFVIFLNESGKGVTSFRANAKGKALGFADSYEIVKKMVENADISSIGITYTGSIESFPYKLVKEPTYFSLKRITASVTKKEIVDDVLCQLKKYQSRKKN